MFKKFLQRHIGRAGDFKLSLKSFLIGALICGGLVLILITAQRPPSAPAGTQSAVSRVDTGRPSSAESKGFEPDFGGEDLFLEDKIFNRAMQNETPPHFPIKTNKKKLRVSEEYAHETVTAREKGLVFGGRGFDVREFSRKSGLPLRTGLNLHLETETPLPRHAVKDKLDITPGEIRGTRPLIFHSRPVGFFPAPPQLEKEDESEVPSETSIQPGSIPETKLLLSQGGESLLILEPAEKSIDLLENENLSMRRYRQLP